MSFRITAVHEDHTCYVGGGKEQHLRMQLGFPPFCMVKNPEIWSQFNGISIDVTTVNRHYSALIEKLAALFQDPPICIRQALSKNCKKQIQGQNRALSGGTLSRRNGFWEPYHIFFTQILVLHLHASAFG